MANISVNPCFSTCLNSVCKCVCVTKLYSSGYSGRGVMIDSPLFDMPVGCLHYHLWHIKKHGQKLKTGLLKTTTVMEAI